MCPASSKNTFQPSPVAPVVVGNCPVVGCPAFASVEAICRPLLSAPWLTSTPAALTLVTAFQPVGVVGAVVVQVVPSVEYEITHPAGAMMSAVLDSRN